MISLGIRINLSRCITLFLQGFVVLCLIGGLLDLLYPPISFVKHWLIRNIPPPQVIAEPGSLQDIIKMQAMPYRYLPSLGRVLTAYEAPGVHIDAYGMRSNGGEPPVSPRTTGYLLGSSQAFGYNIRDDQTLSAHLERILQFTRIQNYSGLNKSLPETVMRWHELSQQKEKPDFVLIADGMVTLARDCFLQQDESEETRTTIFQYLYGIFRTKNGHISLHCQTENGRNQAVNHALYEVQATIEYGRRQKIPFLLVVTPNPWIAGQNLSNLDNSAISPQHRQMMEAVYRSFFEQLNSLGYPEVLDLSKILPDEQPYFLDKGAHLSGNGNKILASSIAAALKTLVGKLPG